MGLITYRIAMILSIIRQMGNANFKNIVACDGLDLDMSLEIVECLIVHTTYVYNQIKSTNGGKKKEKAIATFYDNLPNDFSWKSACSIADLLTIKHKTAEFYIGKYIKEGMLERVQHGQYAKR